MKKLLFILPFFLSFAQAEPFQCKVVEVINGDTMTCLTEQKELVKVKLHEINAPKLAQPYGQEAKQLLSDIVLNKDVYLDIIPSLSERLTNLDENGDQIKVAVVKLEREYPKLKAPEKIGPSNIDQWEYAATTSPLQ